jgi:hypothetical protein
MKPAPPVTRIIAATLRERAAIALPRPSGFLDR